MHYYELLLSGTILIRSFRGISRGLEIFGWHMQQNADEDIDLTHKWLQRLTMRTIVM